MIIKEFETKIISEEPIVDLEISNDLENSFNIESYLKSDIVTFGIINKNKIKIIQREKSDDIDKFKEEIKKELSNVSYFYAFNNSFEKYVLFGFMKEEYDVKELKLWKGKGWNKDKFFEEISKIVEVENKPDDPLNGEGELVPKKYAENKYEEIILHNLNCLIKESYIKKYGSKLLEKYKDNVSDDGWFNRDDVPATPKQIDYLISLGCKDMPKTQAEASKLIDLLKNTNQNEIKEGSFSK